MEANRAYEPAALKPPIAGVLTTPARRCKHQESTTLDSSPSIAKARQANPRHGDRERFLQKQNQGEIESIARELNRPFAEIAALYDDIFAHLKSRALVTDYLTIFATRTVRLHYQNSVSH